VRRQLTYGTWLTECSHALPRIAKFLGEAKDHTEQASALDALAQSAMEAAHELKRRSGRGA